MAGKAVNALSPDLVRHTEGCFRALDAMHDASPLRLVERAAAQAGWESNNRLR